MVQLVIRNAVAWWKSRVSSENKSENTCCTILLPLFSINLAAALVPGHTASAQSKHQLWMRVCEQCNVCMSVDDRGVEGGGANARLTDLPLNIWLLPKPNPDGTLSVCWASPHQSQQATPLSPATSYRVHHWADDYTQKKKNHSLTTLIAVWKTLEMLLWKLPEAEQFCFKIKTAVFKVTKLPKLPVLWLFDSYYVQ